GPGGSGLVPVLPRDPRVRRRGEQHQQPVDDLIGHHAASTTGSSSRNAIPPPARGAAEMRPPCASAVRLTIASPSPVPRGFREKKGSKRRGSAGAGTPGPVSLTRTVA